MSFYIIVVSFNAGNRLEKTIRSILSQTYTEYRIIIQDSVSTDGSIESLKSNVPFDRICLYSEKDDGIYDAMNRAVKRAYAMEETAYCIFLNCGDLFYNEDVLKDLADKMARSSNEANEDMRGYLTVKSSGVGIFYGDTFYPETGQVDFAFAKMNDFACYRRLPCHQSCVYKLSLMVKEPYDTSYTVRADYEQFLRLKYKEGAIIRKLNMVIASYEGGGFSHMHKDVSEKERKQIIRKYLPGFKIWIYDLYRLVSLQPLRERLAESKFTAPLYHRLKKRLCGR